MTMPLSEIRRSCLLARNGRAIKDVEHRLAPAVFASFELKPIESHKYVLPGQDITAFDCEYDVVVSPQEATLQGNRQQPNFVRFQFQLFIFSLAQRAKHGLPVV